MQGGRGLDADGTASALGHADGPTALRSRRGARWPAPRAQSMDQLASEPSERRLPSSSGAATNVDPVQLESTGRHPDCSAQPPTSKSD